MTLRPLRDDTPLAGYVKQGNISSGPVMPREPQLYLCDKCGESFQTRVGFKAHQDERHGDGDQQIIPLRPVTRYWIDMTQWPELVIIRREGE